MKSPLILYDEDCRRDALIASVDSIRYTNTTINDSKSPFEFTTNSTLIVPKVSSNNPFYTRCQNIFNVEEYQYACPPIELGHSRLTMKQLTSIPNILRMPIKYPTTSYKIPYELAPLFDLIQRVSEYEASFNESVFSDCFVHLTFDKAHIKENTTHRYPGFHGDGVQGSKFSQNNELTIVEHSYVITSTPPTQFCIQPFFINHLTDAKHNIFHEFELQAKKCNIYETLPWHIYLIDPYMVHRTPNITSCVERIFIRITFTYSELMNPHNTRSPFFPDQKYNSRHDIRKFLSTYPSDIPWSLYGFSNGPISRYE